MDVGERAQRRYQARGARLRADARGGDGGVREKLATGMNCQFIGTAHRRTFLKCKGSGLVSQDRSLCVWPKQSISISVADPYLADTRHPAPTARSDHHDAAAEAAAPVTMAVVVIAHSTTTPPSTTTVCCGRN